MSASRAQRNPDPDACMAPRCLSSCTVAPAKCSLQESVHACQPEAWKGPHFEQIVRPGSILAEIALAAQSDNSVN